MRPNVVILLLDTARADAFESYGARVGASPVTADLAAGGTAVPRAYAPSNWTIPSHASMFTGRLPRSLGFGQPAGNWGLQCSGLLESNTHRLLPAVLQEAGYATRAVSANAWITPKTGFGLGFDEFVSARGRRYEGVEERGLKAELKFARQAVRAEIDDGAASAARTIEGWLDGMDGQPFFLFANLVECHSPYLPPRPYNSLSPWKRVLVGRDCRKYLTLERIIRINAGDFDVPDGSLERMRVLYADAIRLMDDWIGRLVEALESRGMLDDTILVVTSDHGENFGENQHMAHAMSLDDRLIRVPLVLRGPDGFDVPDRAFNLTELPALLASAVGLEDHPWAQDPVPEAVVAQYDGPLRVDPVRAADLASEWGLGDEAVARLVQGHSCATDGAHKLVRREDGVESYFDLTTDPLETTPTAVPDGAEVGPLRAALERAEGEASLLATETVEADESELEDLEGQLRMLGYL